MTAGLRPFPRATSLMLLALAGCRSGTEPAVGTLRVLFIGNSLTYENNLPGMVAAFANASAGELRIDVQDVSQPNYALEDHWTNSFTLEALEGARWDVVVLQQGPSSLPENQEHLRTWSTRWANRIRQLGGRPALYMVWPDETRLGFFDDVRHSYRSAAEAAEAALYPAGEAWRAAWDLDSTLPLYGFDGYHPSVMGTYLAALTIYHGMTGRPAVGLPGLGDIPDDMARMLQEAAERAMAQHGLR